MTDRLDELIEYVKSRDGQPGCELLRWAVGEISGLRAAEATLLDAYDRLSELRELDRVELERMRKLLGRAEGDNTTGVPCK